MSSSRVPFGRLLAGLGLLAGLLGGAGPARADLVEPFRVQFRESEEGVFRVQWQAPRSFPLAMVPTPLPPEGCGQRADPVVDERQAVWILSATWDCPQGLAGSELVVSFAFVNTDRSTLLRLGLATGEQFVQVLEPGQDRWRVPVPEVSLGEDLWRWLRGGVIAGVQHLFDDALHGIFVVGLVLLPLRRIPSMVGFFSLGQIVAIVVNAVFGVASSGALASSGLPLASLVIAVTVALRRPLGSVWPVMSAAGLVHGLGLAAVLPSPPAFSDLPWLHSLLAAVGMDAGALVLASLGALVLAGVGSKWKAGAEWGLERVVGGGSVAALLFVISLQSPSLVAADRVPAPSLPQLAEAGPRSAMPSIGSQTGVESFVSVEAFEVRHEILVRLADFSDVLGLSGLETVAIELQPAVASQVEELVTSRTSLSLDGEPVSPIVERVDFLSVGYTGVLPRAEPVVERVDEAFVGVTLIAPTVRTPDRISLEWKPMPPGLDALAVTITDPESSRTAQLTPERGSLDWSNQLAEDPTPVVSSIPIVARRALIPLAAIPFFAAMLVALWAAAVKRRRGFEGVARIALALGLLVAPVGVWAIELPGTRLPTAGQARGILAAVLPNVYRALEFREETEAFDRLALSVTGGALAEVYLENRRALEMEERGGARARVEALEVSEVRDVEPTEKGGFSAEAVWVVGGTVTHFGHRHYRRNRYDAEVRLVPVEGMWKIDAVEIYGEERIQ